MFNILNQTDLQLGLPGLFLDICIAGLRDVPSFPTISISLHWSSCEGMSSSLSSVIVDSLPWIWIGTAHSVGKLSSSTSLRITVHEGSCFCCLHVQALRLERWVTWFASPEIKIQRTIITPVKEDQVWRNSNLICIMSVTLHIPNFKSLSQKTAEKSLENLTANCYGETDGEQTKSPTGKPVGY